MAERTTHTQRIDFYQQHLRGASYQAIADAAGVSRECVRYWCRRQRDGHGINSCYARTAPGVLSRFDPKVRFAVLRLRLEHPRWGPSRIRFHLQKRPTLAGLALPSGAQIGRYLHQWSRFRRPRRTTRASQRPRPARTVHQRWQVDVKLGIKLDDGTFVNLYTVREVVGAACLAALVLPAGTVGGRPTGISAAHVQTVLRYCFARWHTRPQEVQTDGESVLAAQRQHDFPTRFTLWLTGLGIVHLITRPGRPTDNAEVKRTHRTVTDYAIVGNEHCDVATLAARLHTAVTELAFDLPSQAKDCARRPPVTAYPELLQPRVPFRPEWELAHFALARVDAYLAPFTWERIVSKVGQIDLGHQRYAVGRAYARRTVQLRFDPLDRTFVCLDPEHPTHELQRWPAKALTAAHLMGTAVDATVLGPQQLPLPGMRPG